MAQRAYSLRYAAIHLELETLSATRDNHALGKEMTSALKRACFAGDAQCALVLCEMGVHPDDAYGARTVPPLICAARAGRADCIFVLLRRGANANRRFRDKNALVFACEGGHMDCVRLLLAAGAETHLPFLSPIAIASCMGRSAIVNLLLDEGAEVDFASVHLSTTSPACDWRILEALLQHGGDPNARDSGRTPLAKLLSGNGVRVNDIFERARVLVSAGADVDARDPVSGLTILDCALALDEPMSTRTIEFLLRAGARARIEDVEHLNSQGAQLVRNAMRPWCSENHYLFTEEKRRMARFLAHVGARVCARIDRSALMHVWMNVVLPLCIVR